MVDVHRHLLDPEEGDVTRSRDSEFMGSVLLVFLLELFFFFGYVGGFFFDLVTGEDQFEIVFSIYLFFLCSVGLILLVLGLGGTKRRGLALTFCIWIRHVQTVVLFALTFVDICLRFNSYKKEIKKDFPKSDPDVVAAFYMVCCVAGCLFHIFCVRAIHKYKKYEEEKDPYF